MELRKLQQQLGITTIVVTHDQREAMTMADTVVVMSGGKIRQAASPSRSIASRPTASWPIYRSTNLLPLTAQGGTALVLGQSVAGISAPAGQGQASLSVRPEDVKLAAPGEGRITGKVTFIRDLGGTIETFLDVAGTEVVAVSTPRERPVVTVGQDVGIVIDPETAVVLSA